jgi:uncharacterized phiE125 gp8 family phage protein
MTLSPLRLEVSALDDSPFPLSLSLVKAHCAVDGTDSDALLYSYMRAAIAWAEGSMHRTIYARSHRLVLADFPRDGRYEIRLPMGKTVSVESIVYTLGGIETTLTGPSSTPEGAEFQEDLRDDGGGSIRPNRGESWPSVDWEAISPVVVNFTAGYAAADVPDDIIHALLFAVSDAYDTRGSADLTGGGNNFATREILISGYRLHRWYV